MELSKNVIEKLSDNKTISDTSKSGKSTTSTKRKSEISPQIIFSSIEREINDLLQEINVRSQKNKLISINEYIKLLSKKFMSMFSESASIEIGNSNIKSSDNIFAKSEPLDHNNSVRYKKEIENLTKNYDTEIKKMKEEISVLQNKLNNNVIINECDTKIQKSNDAMTKLSHKLDQTSFLYSDEKAKNNQLILQIKNLEEALKTLNNEYNDLSFQYGKLQSECEVLEKTISELRKNTNDHKFKFEDLIKINSELKTKLIETENTLKQHTDDMKSLLRKNAMQQKYVEELENKNKQIAADLAYKEERLKALRHMNSKLEQKSNQILKKFDAFRLFEEKTNEVSLNSQRMVEVIEELNRKLSQENHEKENYRRNVEDVLIEKDKIISDCEELRRQMLSLKSMNDELILKNNELENKFKRSLDQRTGESRENSMNISKDRIINKAFNSNSLSNMTNKESFTQKYATANRDNNEVTIDEMKPAKIVITNNNVEVVNK